MLDFTRGPPAGWPSNSSGGQISTADATPGQHITIALLLSYNTPKSIYCIINTHTRSYIILLLLLLLHSTAVYKRETGTNPPFNPFNIFLSSFKCKIKIQKYIFSFNFCYFWWRKKKKKPSPPPQKGVHRVKSYVTQFFFFSIWTFALFTLVVGVCTIIQRWKITKPYNIT